MRIMARQTSRRMSRRGGILPRKAVPASSAHGGGPYETGPSRCGTSGLTFCPTYAYQYDDIGNRLSSLDIGTNRTYAANALNQYTNIVEGAGGFLPQFDDDGNQTLIKTATGVWQVSYNGENRPVLWECGATNIVMSFDRMGRRVEYIETVSGVTNTHHRFVYDGYLCIQRLNAASNNSIDLVFGWDPSEQVATRPLILQKYGAYSLFYTHDGNKNVSELVFFQQANGIAAHYEYAPFGAVTVTSKSTPVTAYDFREYNPFRFSSEYADDALGLMYYNYRHYGPVDGMWCGRDRISYNRQPNLYLFANNCPIVATDYLGLQSRGLRGYLSPCVLINCDELKKNFEQWYNGELDSDNNWVSQLPSCPSELAKITRESISFIAGAFVKNSYEEFVSPDYKEWQMSETFGFTQIWSNFHPNGVYELRTKDPSKYAGHGNQCIYDKCGKLITEMPSAGTVDKTSSNYNVSNHQNDDVHPFYWAQDLDECCGGNGHYVKKYYEVRPSK